MSDSSRGELYYVEETTIGVTPAEALKEFRMTSEALVQNSQFAPSEEVESSRNVNDVTRTSIDAGGDIPFELSYGLLDDLIEGALANDWSAAVNLAGTDIAATATGFSSTSSDFVAAGIVVGQFIKMAGFATASINTYYRVTEVSANSITTANAPAATEVAGASVTVTGQMLSNGVTRKSYTWERKYADLGEFVAFTGMVVASMSMNVQPGAMITGSLSFTGMKGTPSGETVGTGAPVAAAANRVLNAVDNIDLVREGGQVTTLDITQLSFELNNNPRTKPAIGNLAPVDVGLGRCMATGNLTAYFESRTLLEKYFNDTRSDLTFAVTDEDGNTLIFDFPKTVYTSGGAPITGNDADVTANMAFQAYKHPDYGFSVAVHRFPAA